MKREEPLVMRLSFHAQLYELVRLISYDGVAEAVLRETLRPEVRKLCWGILGPPPEHPDYDFIKHGPVLAFKEDVEAWKKEFAAKKAAEKKPPDPVKPPKKARTRKKAAK